MHDRQPVVQPSQCIEDLAEDCQDVEGAAESQDAAAEHGNDMSRSAVQSLSVVVTPPRATHQRLLLAEAATHPWDRAGLLQHE